MTVPFRILSLLLCLLVAGPMSLSAHAVARPETRVGKIFPDSLKSAPANPDQTLEPRGENRGCGYDFASGVYKYLYGHNDPVNGMDPSGQETLTELMTTTFIQTVLVGFVAPAVVEYGAGKALVGIIPETVQQNLATAVAPDAVSFGLSGSGNLPVGKYPVGITAGGGVEALVSPKTFKGALYGYLSGGFAFGKNTRSGSVQGTFGLVFNTPTSQNYTKHFLTVSVPYKRLPQKIQSNIDKILASGFGATIGGSSAELVQEAQSIGIQLSGIVDKSTVNVFFDPKGGSVGVSFSYGIASTKDATSNPSITYSYYWQLLPEDDAEVPFR